MPETSGIGLLQFYPEQVNSGQFGFILYQSFRFIHCNNVLYIYQIHIYGYQQIMLPFRYKYTYMEEMLGNVPGARQVFERWMEWEPEEQSWFSYIKMEMRYKEVDRARSIYERFVLVHPDVKNWIKFAKFEESQGKVCKFAFSV